MRVQATKKMANELNKALKGTRFDGTMHFTGCCENMETYNRYVSTLWEDMEQDFDYRTGKYKYIKITYPAEYYALEGYIATADLRAIFKNAKTWDAFSKAVFEEYAI